MSMVEGLPYRIQAVAVLYDACQQRDRARIALSNEHDPKSNSRSGAIFAVEYDSSHQRSGNIVGRPCTEIPMYA
jgi:hypothetical protein